MRDGGQAANPAVAERLERVRAEIREACREAGRDPAEVCLVAVSKAQPLERIEAALRAGQRVFGENYVQEAKRRWPALREAYPDVELHLIGALQTNKARDAVRLFDVIQTIDRPRIAEALAREMDRLGLRRPVFLEVNLGEEPQKAGVTPEALPALLRLCREQLELPVLGLMAIPPLGEEVAPYAALLAKLAREHGLEKVSVGMSGDFPTAIRFGATHVRVGTAIFGPRPERGPREPGPGQEGG